MPLSATPLHPEGPRYHATLLFLPGLWSTGGIWRRAGSLLAHRGWEGYLVDTASADELAAWATELERTVVLVGHDAGGLVALHAASRLQTAAVIWAAPFVPGARAMRTMVSPWRVLSALVLGNDVPRPSAWTRDVPAAPWTKEAEAAAPVVDAVRGRVAPENPGVPTVLMTSEGDPLCDAADRAFLEGLLQAETLVVPGPARAPFGGPKWQAAAGLLHRWLVQRLGENLLELYEEAMAERDQDDTE